MVCRRVMELHCNWLLILAVVLNHYPDVVPHLFQSRCFNIQTGWRNKHRNFTLQCQHKKVTTLNKTYRKIIITTYSQQFYPVQLSILSKSVTSYYTNKTFLTAQLTWIQNNKLLTVWKPVPFTSNVAWIRLLRICDTGTWHVTKWIIIIIITKMYGFHWVTLLLCIHM